MTTYSALTNVKTTKEVKVSSLGSGLGSKSIPEGEIGLLLDASVRVEDKQLVTYVAVFFPDIDMGSNLRLDEIELVSFPVASDNDALGIIGERITQLATLLLAARSLEDLPSMLVLTPEIEDLLQTLGFLKKEAADK